MKAAFKLLRSLLPIFLIVCCACAQRPGRFSGKNAALPTDAENLKRRVIVLPFENQTPYLKGRLPDWLAEELTNWLFEKNFSTVVSNGEWQGYLRETRLTNVIWIRDQSLQPAVAENLARGLGVHAVIFGEVLDFEMTHILPETKGQNQSPAVAMRFSLHVVAVPEAREYLNKVVRVVAPLPPTFKTSAQGSPDLASVLSRERLTDLLERSMLAEGLFLFQSLDRIPWRGQVLRLASEGKEVMIRGGKQTGLKIGDTLRIENPEGGRSRAILRLENYSGHDNAICQVIEGGPIVVGDWVTP